MNEYNGMNAESKQSLPIEIAVQNWCGKYIETPYATLDNKAQATTEKDYTASPLVQAIQTLLYDLDNQSN